MKALVAALLLALAAPAFAQSPYGERAEVKAFIRGLSSATDSSRAG